MTAIPIFRKYQGLVRTTLAIFCHSSHDGSTIARFTLASESDESRFV